VCPSGARRLAGRSVEPDTLAATLAADADFFRGTGGGVTLSGGEPLAQPEFALALAACLRERGVAVAVETAGFWPAALVPAVAAAFDLVLFDLKLADAARLTAATRGDGRVVLANLDALAAHGAPLALRYTLVPDVNDDDEALDALAAVWLRLGRSLPLELLAHHRLAAAKSDAFGLWDTWSGTVPVVPEDLRDARARLAALGVRLLPGAPRSGTVRLRSGG
jgi:pyruvate formate lyase activating enzyme